MSDDDLDNNNIIMARLRVFQLVGDIRCENAIYCTDAEVTQSLPPLKTHPPPVVPNDKRYQLFFINDLRSVVEKVEKLEKCQVQSELFDGLLEIVIRYLGSPYDAVRSIAIVLLLDMQTSPAFSHNNFIDVIKKVLKKDSCDTFQQLEIMYTLAPILGQNNTFKCLWPKFVQMVKETSNPCLVRQGLVRTLGMFCRILGSELTENVLWPIYEQLSNDNSWRVRQQCARILPVVSLFFTPQEREDLIAPLIKNLLRDPTRYVFRVASDMLGIYLATFAKPRILTVYVSPKMELSLPNPADEDFKECLQKESEHEKLATYEEMFSETLNRHSYTAPTDVTGQEKCRDIIYPLDVGGRILEKYFKLSNLSVKLHLAGSDEANLRCDLEDYFNNIRFDCWIMDFKNIISDKIKFEKTNLSEFFPYRPAVDDPMYESRNERVPQMSVPLFKVVPMRMDSKSESWEEEDDDSDEESSQEMEELFRDLQEESPDLWRKLSDAHSERKKKRYAKTSGYVTVCRGSAQLSRRRSAEAQWSIDDPEPECEPENIPPPPIASIAPIVATPTDDESSHSTQEPPARGPNTTCHLKRNTPHDLRVIISEAIQNSIAGKSKVSVDVQLNQEHLPAPPPTASIENAQNFEHAFDNRAEKPTFAKILARGLAAESTTTTKNENIVSDLNDNPSCEVDFAEEINRLRLSEESTADSNENWCCDRLSRDCENNGNDDDDEKAFNSHNFWYIAPDSVSLDDINGGEKSMELLPTDEALTSSSPTADHTFAMSNVSMKMQDPAEQWYTELTRAQMIDHYSETMDPVLLKQDILPPELLQIFITKATDETDVSIAYSFPAVALTLGRQNWHILLPTLQLLCANPKMCPIVISSFYQIALIVGREHASNDLLPLYLRFFDNYPRIRREALKIVPNFLSTVDEVHHVDVIAKLPICLADFHKANETKYHVRENFMNVVLSLMHMYDRRDAPADCVNYLTAYALAMLVDKVHQVRELALEALVVRVRTCSERDFVNLLQAVTEECGDSAHWRNRQSFVRLIHRWVDEDFIDMRVFVRDILPRLLVLASDRVPNIRLCVGRCLYKSVINHHHFSKASMEEEKNRVQVEIERLQNDDDMDVRESSGGVGRSFLQYFDDAMTVDDDDEVVTHDDQGESVRVHERLVGENSADTEETIEEEKKTVPEENPQEDDDVKVEEQQKCVEESS
ncbi:hypothetical protein DMENIID0001_162760 [Sergentomyia squamirostris]